MKFTARRARRSPGLAGPGPAALLVTFHSRAPAGGEALNARRPKSQIRVTGVESAAAPFDHSGVIPVARVQNRLEKLEIAVWAANVLGRTAPLAGDEPRAESARDTLLDGLYCDVVPPSVAEVVSVTEASVALGDQGLEPDVAGGPHLAVEIKVRIGNAVSAVTGLELVEMVILPAERGLVTSCSALSRMLTGTSTSRQMTGSISARLILMRAIRSVARMPSAPSGRALIVTRFGMEMVPSFPLAARVTQTGV